MEKIKNGQGAETPEVKDVENLNLNVDGLVEAVEKAPTEDEAAGKATAGKEDVMGHSGETSREKESELQPEEKEEVIDLEGIARRDARIGHLLVDLIAGGDVDAAVKRHFGDVMSASAEAIASAEQRGYLRARNELAEREMERPGVWADSLESTAEDPELGFLDYIKPSVWD